MPIHKRSIPPANFSRAAAHDSQVCLVGEMEQHLQHTGSLLYTSWWNGRPTRALVNLWDHFSYLKQFYYLGGRGQNPHGRGMNALDS